jgi:hypothetical protein
LSQSFRSFLLTSSLAPAVARQKRDKFQKRFHKFWENLDIYGCVGSWRTSQRDRLAHKRPSATLFFQRDGKSIDPIDGEGHFSPIAPMDNRESQETSATGP